MAKRFIVRPPRKSPEIGSMTITVDDKDAHWLRAYPWHVLNGSGGNRSVRLTSFKNPYAGADGTGRQLGQLILGVNGGGRVVHLDGDDTNYRRENLRLICADEVMAHVRAARRCEKSQKAGKE